MALEQLEAYAISRGGELTKVTPLMLPPGALVLGLVEVEGERYEVRKVGFEATTVDIDLIQRVDRVLFWAFRETTGSAGATFRLRDGSDTGGEIIAPFALLKGGSTRDWMGPQGIPCRAGVYLEMLSGSVEGSVTVAVRREHDE